MSAEIESKSGPTFVCPFCSRHESVHNRPLHLRTCLEAERDVQIERVQRNTIDAEYDRAMAGRR